MKLLIATPSRNGTVQVPFAVSLCNTIKALSAANIEVRWQTLCFASFIQAAREKMAREFMDSDYTDLLFADDDMGWDLGGILNLLAHDVDVVGAICPKRKDPIEWAVGLTGHEQDGLLECSYIGTALLRIRRGAFEKLPGRYFDAMFEGDRMIGEDAWFCREYRKHGGRVWADPNITVTHTGPKDWRGNYSEWIANK